MGSSPLLDLPPEIWDRILFWMSLLPIDVANFAKASVRCHFLTFGPVGDRNHHNLVQHRALTPIKNNDQLDSVEKWHAALLRAKRMGPAWSQANFGWPIYNERESHFLVLMRSALSAQQVGLLSRLVETLDKDKKYLGPLFDRVAAMRIKCGSEESSRFCVPWPAANTQVYYSRKPLLIAAMVAESRFDWLGQIELEYLNYPIAEAMRSGNAEVLRWLLDRFDELGGDQNLVGHCVDSDLLLLENNPGLTPEVFAVVLEWFGARIPIDRLKRYARTVFSRLQSPEGQPFLDAAGPILQQSDRLQTVFSTLITYSMTTTQYVAWWWVCYAVEYDLKMSINAVLVGLRIGCELRQVAADAGQEEEKARASRVVYHLAFRTRLVDSLRRFARRATNQLMAQVNDPEEFARTAEFMFDGEVVAPVHTVFRLLMVEIDEDSGKDREADTSTVINGLKPYL